MRANDSYTSPRTGAARLRQALSWACVFLVLVAGVIPGPLLARAQGSRCNAQPASASGLVAVLSSPFPEDPAAADPRGEVLPPAERIAIGDLVSRWSGCLADGNLRGMLGLFTADGVRRLFAERAPIIGGPAGLQISILAVNDVVRMADGRVAGRVSVDPTGNGSAPPETVIFVIAQGNDGVWRIDHILVQGDPTGAAGVPERDPNAPRPALLRRPIAPGPSVPVAAPGPSVPMRGGDAARSGNQPGPAPGSAPVERWRAPVGWQSTAQPVMARGVVALGGFSLGGRLAVLEAVDSATGGVRWQTTAPVGWAEFPDAPALAGDLLFAPVQAPVSGVMAVVAGTGQPVWYAPFGFTSVTAPAVDADTVFVSGWGVSNARDRSENAGAGMVYALDQRTGKERWKFLTPARFGPLAVGRNAIFVSSDRGLFALERTTGKKLWQARFTPGFAETPVVAGDVVAFAGTEVTSGSTGVFALDAASGALKWRVDLPASPGARAGAAVAQDTAYVTWWEPVSDGSKEGIPTLRAYELASGKERWIYRAGGDVAKPTAGRVGAVTAPTIVGAEVYFGVATEGATPEQPADLDGIYAVDAASGKLRWQGARGTPIASPPTVLNGVIYAIGGVGPQGDAASGSLIAFGPA